MILVDTGPLVALIDKSDPNHARCVAATRQLPKTPLVTTWPCMTEAMYFLHKEGGSRAQRKLWDLRRAGTLIVQEITETVADRMEALMSQYSDIPMDIADASLVAAAEQLNLVRIFTTDSHFVAFRVSGDRPFEVIP